MKNLLLLTDFSDLSGYARSLADKIGSSVNAKLHVLKIIDVPSEIQLNPEGELIGGMGADLSEYEEEKKTSDTLMPGWVLNLKSEVVPVVKYGSILHCIKKYVEDNDIDLVVMGVNEVSGIGEAISGSLAESVILKNTVPVLTLKCDRNDIDFSDFLVTGDFRADHKVNLDCIKLLQKVFNSTIHLLCVNTSSKFKSASEAMKKMKAFAELNELENVKFHQHSDKSTEEGIINFANNYDQTHELDIDVVVVEKKDKSTLNRWFTGCEAIDVVNHVYRPILTYNQ